MGVEARRHPRQRVHLRVAYRNAREFVEQYAHNLSAGGLFVRDAVGLALGEEVSVELDLPGHGAFTIAAEVAHVVRPGEPGGRIAGAGLQIKRAPPGFQRALSAYLVRLGKRTSATVFVDIEPWRQMIADAGYRVASLPPTHRLAELVVDATSIAVLAPEGVAQQYAAAISFLGGDTSSVIAVHAKLPVDPVLAWLDDKLLAT